MRLIDCSIDDYNTGILMTMEDETETIKYLKGFKLHHFAPAFALKDFKELQIALIDGIGHWYDIKILIRHKNDTIYLNIHEIDSI